jgi:hypothetical protein
VSEAPEGRHNDIRPVPDPTTLTTEASTRLEMMLRALILSESAHLNELFAEKIIGIVNTFDERFATFDEKLSEIKTQLRMLDARTAEQKKDTKDALDAALAAQKEQVANQTISSEKSINKSETATVERIKAVEALLATSAKATDDKISDLKERVIAIEAVKLGGMEQTATIRATGNDMRGNMAAIISVVTIIIAVVSVLITVFVVTKH